MLRPINSRNVLFANADIFSVIQNRTAAVKQRVQEIPSEKLLNASEVDLVQALVTEFSLEIPVLADEGYIADSSETPVDVSHDPMRLVRDCSRPFYISGNRTVIAIPFTGDPEFFRIRPQTFSLGGIRADVGKGELLLTYTSAAPNGDAIRREYEQTSKTIRDHLSSLRDSANQFNNQLENLVRSQIKARKDRLLADAQMTAAIGLPMKKREGMALTFRCAGDTACPEN